MISVSNLQIKSSTGKVLFQNSTFEIKSGSVVGIYGPNGSGKSTLLKALAGGSTNQVVTGENIIENVNIFNKDLNVKDKVKKILYLGSDFLTSFQISVRELLDIAKEVNLDSKENALEIAERFSIRPLLSRSFNELSDGEKQRVMLARGVIQAPHWLVLDETFSKVDLDHSFHLTSELKEITKKGRGIILASHDLNLISEFVDELWLIKDGKIVASGPLEEILTTENLRLLYPNRLVQVVRSSDNGKKKVLY